ncbi:cytidine deaminase-like fold-containing protein [Pseudomonas zeae]
MELRVSGKAVCGFCRGDIAAMANESGLSSLTIKELATGKTLYWRPGMKSVKEVK